MTELSNVSLIDLTADIVSAHVSNNTVATGDLPLLIAAVHGALQKASTPVELPAETLDRPAPAVSVRKSAANPEFLISMIDGKPYKTLKRHISRHGYTVDSYREAFGLPANYPMVAPAYSEHRRKVAMDLGLGRKPKAKTTRARKAR